MGTRKINGPGAIADGLLIPILHGVNQLHSKQVLPGSGKALVWYVIGLYVLTLVGVWLFYSKIGRRQRVMNDYRGRFGDTAAYHYAYVFGWIALTLIFTLMFV